MKKLLIMAIVITSISCYASEKMPEKFSPTPPTTPAIVKPNPHKGRVPHITAVTAIFDLSRRRFIDCSWRLNELANKLEELIKKINKSHSEHEDGKENITDLVEC